MEPRGLAAVARADHHRPPVRPARARPAGHPQQAQPERGRGRPVLKRRRGRERHASALALEAALLERLPARGILTRTAYAIGWYRHFGPAAGPMIRQSPG